MTVKSVLGAEEITGTALSDLATILQVLGDEKGLKKKLLLVAEETAKLAAERAAIGSLAQIEALREEAEEDRDDAAAKLNVAASESLQIVRAGETKARGIVEKAEAKASKNAEWAANLKTLQDDLTKQVEALVGEQRDVKRREDEAKEAQDRADELIKEAEALKVKFQGKLDAMAKLQAA